MKDLLQEYLSLRREAASEVLLSGRAQSARTALSATVQTIVDTLTIGHCLFLRSGLEHALKQLREAGPSLTLLGTSALGPMEARLPHTVRGFRPRVNTALVLEQSEIQAGISSWLQEIGAGAKSEAVALLQFVESVQGVSAVREELRSSLSAQAGWKEVAGEVVQAPVCLWDSVYREPLTSRVLALLADKVRVLRTSIEKEVLLVLQAEGEDECVWKEVSKDVGGGRSKEQLESKCRGWGPMVQEVLASLEHGLAGLWTEAQLYCHDEKSEEEIAAFDMSKDSNQIREKVGEEVSRALSSLLSSCKVEAGTRGGSGLLQFGRLVQALNCLCPSLDTVLGTEQLAEMTKLLETESKNSFSSWVSEQLKLFSLSLAFVTTDTPLCVLPSWDKVSIEETGDSGEQVSSIILIPPSPSLPLHSSLLALSSKLHGANASSFPSTTLPEANSKLLDLLLDHYSNLAGGKISQNMALQFSFDLRFLQTLLVSREAKDIRSPTFTSLMERVESHIDPFDLSVFSSHLETRVRWAAARSVSGLAALVPPDRAALVASYKPPSATSSTTGGQDGHNVLTLPHPSAPRFQLLPLSTPAAPALPTPLGLPTLAATDTNRPAAAVRRIRDRSPVTQTAASFFGSMSQSWFGGGAAGQ